MDWFVRLQALLSFPNQMLFEQLEELERLAAKRVGEFECARKTLHLAESVGEVLLSLRLPATTGLLTPHPGQLPALLRGEFVPVRICSTPDLGRKPSVVTGCGQRGAGPLPFVRIVRPPLRPVVEALLFDDEATVLADGFLDVRSDLAVTLGTLVPARLRLDVLVEASFVDVSDCHRSHRIQELASTANPSPLEGENNTTSKPFLHLLDGKSRGLNCGCKYLFSRSFFEIVFLFDIFNHLIERNWFVAEYINRDVDAFMFGIYERTFMMVVTMYRPPVELLGDA
jgi:hypothetical protein